MLDRKKWRRLIATAWRLDVRPPSRLAHDERFSLRRFLAIIEDEKFEPFFVSVMSDENKNVFEKRFGVPFPVSLLMELGVVSFLLMAHAANEFDRPEASAEAA